MKKIFLIIMLLGFYTHTFGNFSENKKNYCTLKINKIIFEKKIEELKTEINSSFSVGMKKYSYIIDFRQRQKLIDQDLIFAKDNLVGYEKLLQQNINFTNEYLNYNHDFLYLDCYKINKNNNINIINGIKIKKVGPNKLFSDSKIIIEGTGFGNKFYSNIKLFIVFGDFEYEITNYYKYSNTRLELAIPNDLKGIVNNMNGYNFKFCKNDKCIYSNNIDGNITNDKYSYMQYYLDKHNIINARKTIENPKKVIIAVIDDGLSLNHSDLTDNIWINGKEIPGNGIDDDKNGYVDDYNSWNFVYNGNNTKPLGKHGTKIAGIIGAQINNGKGIGGILNNVKIMSVGVCDNKGCKDSNVIKGIKYAVDNGANIINISLGDNQFYGYNNKYNDILKYAYEKNIIVVIAGGNGDVLSNNSNGVNTTINKISPVCNYGNNYKNIIGVGSQDINGYKSNWSNYGNCIDFYAMGERIYSTSFLETINNSNSLDQNYISSDGTSFSAPIITGIIGLGYEKFGKINRTIIYNSLKESIINGVIDAKKYLEVLSKNVGEIKTNNSISETIVKTEINSSINNFLKNRINSLFSILENKINKEDLDMQITIYNRINSKIDKLLKGNLSNKNKLIITYLKEIIINKLQSINPNNLGNDFLNGLLDNLSNNK